jgi:hypothetical protein
MLHQNVKAQGFRVLNEDEIGAVCGGFSDNILVTAPSSNSNSSSLFWAASTNPFNPYYMGGDYEREQEWLQNQEGMYEWQQQGATNATPAQPPQQPPGLPQCPPTNSRTAAETAAAATFIVPHLVSAARVLIAGEAGAVVVAELVASSIGFFPLLAGAAVVGAGVYAYDRYSGGQVSNFADRYIFQICE